MMQRYDPYRRWQMMQREMDRMMDDRMLIPALVYRTEGGGQPQTQPHRIELDVVEQGDNLLVRASLPGVKPEDVNVTVEQGILTIRGEVHGEHEHGEGRFRHRERHYGSFSRSVMLPDDVDVEACEAGIENGVLTLTFPKAAHARSRRIPIRGSGRSTGEGNRDMMSGNGADTGRPDTSAISRDTNPEGSITRPDR